MDKKTYDATEFFRAAENKLRQEFPDKDIAISDIEDLAAEAITEVSQSAIISAVELAYARRLFGDTERAV